MYIFIKPKDGYSIIDPVLRSLVPAYGRRVPDSPFWQRRIRDKDVTVMDEKTAAKEILAGEDADRAALADKAKKKADAEAKAKAEKETAAAPAAATAPAPAPAAKS